MSLLCFFVFLNVRMIIIEIKSEWIYSCTVAPLIEEILNQTKSRQVKSNFGFWREIKPAIQGKRNFSVQSRVATNSTHIWCRCRNQTTSSPTLVRFRLHSVGFRKTRHNFVDCFRKGRGRFPIWHNKMEACLRGLNLMHVFASVGIMYLWSSLSMPRRQAFCALI